MRLVIVLGLLLVTVSSANAGWAIQRPDGTYRGWSCCGKDDALLPGESYVKMDAMPTVGPDAATLAKPKPTPIGDAIDAIKTLDDVKTLLKERLK